MYACMYVCMYISESAYERVITSVYVRIERRLNKVFIKIHHSPIVLLNNTAIYLNMCVFFVIFFYF